MKSILFAITLLFVALTVRAQVKEYDGFYYEQVKEARQSRNEGWKTLAVYGGSIILNGIGGGFNDSGKKTVGHLFNAASIGTLLLSPKVMKYSDKWWKYALSYTFIRVGLFDVTYNATRHLPYNYTGTTSITDKIYNKGGGGQTFVRFTVLVVGVGFTLNLK